VTRRKAQSPGSVTVVEDCFAGSGEMGSLMRETDWSRTPLGPVSSWPQSLRTSVSICLNSLFPTLIWWGPNLIMLYNDSYRPILGTTKHPRALGARGHEIWPEIWSIIGPMLHGVLTTGQSAWSDAELLMLDRNGYLEECYFTFSYSPIRQEDGQVGGVFCAVREVTERVLLERRLRILQELAHEATQAKTKEQACQTAVRSLVAGRVDVPFAAFYLLEGKGTVARLVGASELKPGSHPCPNLVDLTGSHRTDPWGFAEVLQTRVGFLIKDLGALSSSIPVTHWGKPPERAIVTSLLEPGSDNAGAILVAGLNPCRAWDQSYRRFFDLAAGYISAAIATAIAYEGERRRTEALLELDRAKTATSFTAEALRWLPDGQIDADRALRENEERLRLATDIGRIGTWYLDLEKDRVEFSERCRAIFELEPNATVSLESIMKVVHPEDRLKLGKAVDHALTTTEDVHTDYRLLLPDGSIRWVMARSRSVADELGRIRANFGVAMDITATKEFEQRLLDFNARLEQRVNERTEEVRRLAEHLRALTSELTQAEQRERKRVATILHDHIQQLLVAARMQIGIGRRSIKEPDPLETLARADRHLAEAIQASRSLTTELSPPILHEAGLAAGLNWLAEQAAEQHQWTVDVVSDPDAEPESEDVRLFLFGAVRELLFNACKYSGVSSARITMTRASDKWVRIVVEDQGRGFDPDAIKKADRPTPGGFGLFSIQQRLSYMGGKMEIDSSPGNGTRVILLAPLEDVRADDTVAAVSSVAIGQTPSIKKRRESGRIRVIVADDHKVMREGLRSMLQLEPDILVVGEAEDGEQAVELARQLQPDVILMDITMPRMGGLEATRVICNQLPHIRIIGLSMHVDSAIIATLMEAGACAYLTKDEPIERVISTIRGVKSAPVSAMAEQTELN
jgi:PAS domain S-box-containing protein